MEQIVFSQGWQSYFNEYGLRSFDDFYYCDADFNILCQSKGYVNSVSFGNDSQRKTFFIKRFAYCHLSDIFQSLYNFGRLRSQAFCEYENAAYLMKKGFGVYRPLCFGDRTTLGIERESFVVTEGLSSQSMDGFVVKNFEKLENSEKEQILKDLGKTIRRIHDCDISLPDLYIWHLFINKNQRGQYEFAVIDLHRMKYRVTSSNEKIKNLSRLDYSLRDEYFDENLRRVLIEAYTGDCSREAVDSLFCKVRQGAAKLLRRRKQKPYLTY